jgi:hypothetical protein
VHCLTLTQPDLVLLDQPSYELLGEHSTELVTAGVGEVRTVV